MNNTKSNVEFEYNKYLDFCQQNNITQKPAYGNWEEHLRQESLRINNRVFQKTEYFNSWKVPKNEK